MHDLLDKTPLAALATLDKETSTPFTSLVAFALDGKGNPVVFISDLALHTKNLEKQADCSLMVSELDADNVFSSKRITYMGSLEKVTKEDEVKELEKAYVAKHPGAEGLLKFGDFAFYRLKIKKIYFIGGFGGGDWIDLDEYQKLWVSDK